MNWMFSPSGSGYDGLLADAHVRRWPTLDQMPIRRTSLEAINAMGVEHPGRDA